jgi:hypothetical protein
MSPVARPGTERRESGSSEPRVGRAIELMADFAERTGLTGAGAPDRYLWTDSFAVCNFLALGELDLATRLVNQVHETLGRYAPGDPRTGWLSRLEERQAREHPTLGGLRIGKALPERQPGDPVDERLEWERDGQYFHYLTKWMHALDQLARSTGQPEFNRWARELAVTACRGFVVRSPDGGGGRPRMVWKMSVDLDRPLVPSMGHHDPLDGVITCAQLRATARATGTLDDGPDLREEAATFRSMLPSDLATGDLLGLGGLLADAWRVVQLVDQDARIGDDLADRLLDAAARGLAGIEPGGELDLPASSRLAFRELGLAIGLAAVSRMRRAAGSSCPNLDRLVPFVAVGAGIEAFWMDPGHRRTAAWLEHRNINEVMLATSLVPDGYLAVRTNPAT